MSARNADAVRKVRRAGSSHLILDFQYFDNSGTKRRYRRDAQIQTMDGARREARQRQEFAANYGSPLGRPASVGFATFVAGTFTTEHMPRFRPSTRVRYANILRIWLLDHFGDQPLDTIGTPEIQALVGKLASAGVQLKGPLCLLRTIVKAAVNSGVLTVAPVVPRCWKDGGRLPSAPTAADVAKLVAGATGWLRTAIALAAFAGLRSGEVRALEARDVELATDRILVRRAFSDDEVRTPKSGNERVVPIAEPLRPLLVEALRCKLPQARVVLNAAGQTPGRQALLSKLVALEDRVGMQRWSFHALRHAFCSPLVRNGASVEAVRLLAGHANLATTQRYVHAAAGGLRAAVALLTAR